jgi:hypothetical protein
LNNLINKRENSLFNHPTITNFEYINKKRKFFKIKLKQECQNITKKANPRISCKRNL